MSARCAASLSRSPGNSSATPAECVLPKELLRYSSYVRPLSDLFNVVLSGGYGGLECCMLWIVRISMGIICILLLHTRLSSGFIDNLHQQASTHIE